MPRLAASMVLAPKLRHFARAYPDVVLTDDSPLDLVAGRFDAGIHLREFIERDMIAVRVSRDPRPAIVGSPGTRAGGLVPALRGLLPLLSKPTAAAGRAVGPHRDPSFVAAPAPTPFRAASVRRLRGFGRFVTGKQLPPAPSA